MEILVLKAFYDKNTHVPYSVGDYYESDDAERIEFLQNEGFLQEIKVEVKAPKKKK